MAEVTNIRNQNHLQQPYIISKVVFAALSPLDQVAARALERYGLIRIVDENDENEENSPR